MTKARSQKERKAKEQSKSAESAADKKIPRIEGDSRAFFGSVSYPQRGIFKEAGWTWLNEKKCWTTSDLLKARQLEEYFKDSAKALARKLAVSHDRAVRESRATKSRIRIPAPRGLTYLPFQRAGIEFIAKRTNVLLADEMGLGKTIEAIGLLNLEKRIRRTLIICPASLKLNWFREVQKWLVRPANIFVVRDGIGFAPNGTNIVIINYDLLKKHQKAIRARKWDLLICDESHALKDPKAARTVAVVGNEDNPGIKAERKLFLTGTPILNRPAELWTTLRYFEAEVNWRHFHTRYCGAFHNGYGWNVSGATNLEELEQKLRSSVMLRRLKDDVLAELPKKQSNVIPLEVTSAKVLSLIEKQKKLYSEAESAVKRAENLRERVKNAKNCYQTVEWREASKLMKQRDEAFDEISRIRHELGRKKVPIVLKMVREELESTVCLIVFAHHRDVIDAIVTGLKNDGITVVSLTGKISPSKRLLVVDRFQSGEASVFVGTIKAAGSGFTLTRASRMLFAESSWTPADLEHAEDRAHRIGQSRCVNISHLFFDDSLDVKLLATTIDKTDIAGKALDGPIKKTAG
jgi:SWI/SNF-related matrix-associated actin-dependent regulator of chromatin subfamily A-like protein 1